MIAVAAVVAEEIGRPVVGGNEDVEIAIAVTDKVRRMYPGGLPTADLRSPDEPLLGIS